MWSQGKSKRALKLIADRKDDVGVMLRCFTRLYVEERPDAKRLDADVQTLLLGVHDYNDYIRLGYYWHLLRLGENGRASELLRSRWHEINPTDAAEPPTWADRMTPERGDYLAVWREMLIGYYLGKVTPERMSALMDNERDFGASAWGRAPQSLVAVRLDWYFYGALLESVSGDPSTRTARLRSGLQRSANVRLPEIYEYRFANMMLDRLDHPASPETDND